MQCFTKVVSMILSCNSDLKSNILLMNYLHKEFLQLNNIRKAEMCFSYNDKLSTLLSAVYLQFLCNFFITARSTKKEIEIVSSVQLSDHHSQYVDLCQWNPKQDIFATASTDKNCFVWNTKDYHNGNPKSVQVSPIENSQQTVSCLAWSPNGKFLILGLFILPVSCLRFSQSIF